MEDGDALKWLRKRVANDELRAWIEDRQGRELSPKQLYFWELILGMPPGQVDRWLKIGDRWIWDNRTFR